MAAGSAGIILLLLFGTQILNWQWPVAIFLAVLALGVYRVRHSIVPVYRVAQLVDHRLDLQDRLSTAYYFRRLATVENPAVDFVEREAIERIAHQDVDRVMPLEFPRSGYVACGLVLTAVVMFGVRYGILRSLDLQKPIANISFDTFRNPSPVEAASARKSVVQQHLEKQLEQLGIPPEENYDREEAVESPTTMNVPAVADEAGGSMESQPGDGQKGKAPGSEEGPGDQQASDKPGGDSKDEGAGQSASQQKGQPQQQGSPKGDPKNAGNNPGVLDKMKDAMANLLNKIGANQQQKTEQASAQDQQQGGKQQMSQKGSQGQGKAQGDNQQSPDPQGGQDADMGDKSPGQQENSSQQASDKAGSDNSKAGMGKSDGDKSIRDAEQLAAMGKISEIFGKRAAEVKGEMSVETPSGKQGLRTSYSRTAANHTGAVAESNRNEIPLIYQSYVQRYFEEVRKAAPSKAKPASP